MKKNPDGVLSRSIAALIGGYVLSNLIAIVVVMVLPLPKIDGVVAAMSAGFALYGAAAIWSFSASTAKLAWLGLLVAIVITLGVMGLSYLWMGS